MFDSLASLKVFLQAVSFPLTENEETVTVVSVVARQGSGAAFRNTARVHLCENIGSFISRRGSVGSVEGSYEVKECMGVELGHLEHMPAEHCHEVVKRPCFKEVLTFKDRSITLPQLGDQFSRNCFQVCPFRLSVVNGA